MHCLTLEEVSPRKSISSTRSFGRDVNTFEELREAIVGKIKGEVHV